MRKSRLRLPLTNAGETQLSIDYGILQMAGAMFGVVIWSHWAACAWMLQVTFRDDSALLALDLSTPMAQPCQSTPWNVVPSVGSHGRAAPVINVTAHSLECCR
jgi:hypothetical protein